jgi:2-polyprenyl-3-methyl-5-hydroxy-6-metoxy-1,4-benzoquinol methylase
MADIDRILQDAIGHHRAGRLDQAERLYRDILAKDSRHADCLHLLGVIALQGGRPAASIDLIGRAIHQNAEIAAYHSNFANACKELGRLAEAAASYRRALSLQPEIAEVVYNLGLVLRDMIALTAAVDCFRRALRLKPDFAEAQADLGITLHAVAAETSGGLLRRQLDGVRGQYESLPFPSRDPEGERHVLLVSAADTLGKVNQYCFGGDRDFSKGVRVLVAGSGTGDSVIWLAHQLRGTGAEIVALDFSRASLDIAKARAAVRGFDAIRWVEASLLDLPRLGLGRFDYISCLGVLHHLPEPEAGIAALESVLADKGGLALMVYGRHGRAAIYAMQDLLRRLTAGIDDPRQRLELARHVLANLPPTNLFRQQLGEDAVKRSFLDDNANLWDTLLHEQDRAYSASEVRGLLAKVGLTVQTFATYQGTLATCAWQYDLGFHLGAGGSLPVLPAGEAEDVAEMLDGNLPLHTVYATRSAQARLSPSAPEAILSVMSERAGRIIGRAIGGDQGVAVLLSNGRIVDYRPSPIGRAFLGQIDGRRSNLDIARSLDGGGDMAILAAVDSDLALPAALHWVTARTINGSAWPILPGAGRLGSPIPHEEPQTIANAWL